MDSTIITRNPATGEPLARYGAHDEAEVDRRLDAAVAACRSWRSVSFAERGALLRTVARQLEQRRDAFGELMAREMGKPVSAGRAEIEKCAWVCRHYADHAAEYLATRPVETDASRSHVRFDPLGPVLAVMPWNFPFWQVFRFAAPALMAGNVGLLKHASNVTGSALAIEALLRDAGLPAGCFQTLLLPASRVEDVIADERIRAVTVTGSEVAGSAVARAAGTHHKKSVLELGGSDPFIVLADADVDQAARVGVEARMVNSGQSCIAAKRFILHRDVAGPFTALFVDHVARLTVGDPLDPATTIGPLAREDLLEDLATQVERTVAAGARVLAGGSRLDRPGYFYAPTVMADVEPDQPAAAEETFGPVAALLIAENDDDAIRLANASRYGLGASLWTGDPARMERFTADLEAGTVFINGMVKSDPRLPFGGVKHSGYGRELGVEGIREFVNVKSVWIG